MKKVYIEAENFRDKAWGIADLGNGTELVLEMAHGYSDLYYRDATTKEVITDEVFYEMPGHEEINEYCRKMHGLEFVRM